MEQIIDLKDIDILLENEIKDVMLLDKNDEARENFLRITKDLKPQKCDIKAGWVSGKYISFTCRFTKNGESEIFKEIVKGIRQKDKEHFLYFMFGLSPDIFQFNPKFILDENEFLYLTITLKNSKLNEES